jgi:hypothetical protein
MQHVNVLATCLHILMGMPLFARVLLLQVKLNRGLDFVQLDDLLVDLKLTPDVLEVPVPRYFIEDRAKVGAAAQRLHKLCRAEGQCVQAQVQKLGCSCLHDMWEVSIQQRAELLLQQGWAACADAVVAYHVVT